MEAKEGTSLGFGSAGLGLDSASGSAACASAAGASAADASGSAAGASAAGPANQSSPPLPLPLPFISSATGAIAAALLFAWANASPLLQPLSPLSFPFDHGEPFIPDHGGDPPASLPAPLPCTSPGETGPGFTGPSGLGGSSLESVPCHELSSPDASFHCCTSARNLAAIILNLASASGSADWRAACCSQEPAICCAHTSIASGKTCGMPFGNSAGAAGA
mmetsp:Transcript_44766/g.120633  ORF Transcript_44766/g.120633 Transcript_44766/m.120633 type:complete len:220 (+) Transcript_44766:250-909(+)